MEGKKKKKKIEGETYAASSTTVDSINSVDLSLGMISHSSAHRVSPLISSDPGDLSAPSSSYIKEKK